MDVSTATSSTSDHDMLTVQVVASNLSDDGSADCELWNIRAEASSWNQLVLDFFSTRTEKAVY